MKIQSVEIQRCPSIIEDLHLVAVLGSAPDGWRCYEAAWIMPRPGKQDIETKWPEAKEAAVAFTCARGRKLNAKEATRYFPGAEKLGGFAP